MEHGLTLKYTNEVSQSHQNEYIIVLLRVRGIQIVKLIETEYNILYRGKWEKEMWN